MLADIDDLGRFLETFNAYFNRIGYLLLVIQEDLFPDDL